MLTSAVVAQNRHRSCVNKPAWPCANKTLFTKTGGRPCGSVVLHPCFSCRNQETPQVVDSRAALLRAIIQGCRLPRILFCPVLERGFQLRGYSWLSAPWGSRCRKAEGVRRNACKQPEARIQMQPTSTPLQAQGWTWSRGHICRSGSWQLPPPAAGVGRQMARRGFGREGPGMTGIFQHGRLTQGGQGHSVLLIEGEGLKWEIVNNTDTPECFYFNSNRVCGLY